MDMQVLRLTKESLKSSRGDIFPNEAIQPALLHLIPLPLVKILIYTPKLFPPPGSSIQSLHTLADSYCPLRCHLAKLYIYLQAALLIFSHKSAPPVVWSDHPGLSLSVRTKNLPVSLTSPGCRAVSSSSGLLIFLPLPTSFLNYCGHCYCPACRSGPQPWCYFLLCSPSSSPCPGSDPEPKPFCNSLISPALAAHPLTCSLHPDSHHISSRLLCSSLGKAHSCLIHINFFLGTALATSTSPHIYLSFSLPHQTAATFLHLSRLLLASSQPLLYRLFLTRGPPSSSCARCPGSLLPFYIFQRKS